MDGHLSEIEFRKKILLTEWHIEWEDISQCIQVSVYLFFYWQEYL